ncbi:hypothetical protein QCD79_34865, partial [Pseudomonas quasicaspiana]|nr:hypothetical protein [Pseudomonas quasicaspiana]
MLHGIAPYANQIHLNVVRSELVREASNLTHRLANKFAPTSSWFAARQHGHRPSTVQRFVFLAQVV